MFLAKHLGVQLCQILHSNTSYPGRDRSDVWTETCRCRSHCDRQPPAPCLQTGGTWDVPAQNFASGVIHHLLGTSGSSPPCPELPGLSPPLYLEQGRGALQIPCAQKQRLLP